jgi:Helix-turn-helix domain
VSAPARETHPLAAVAVDDERRSDDALWKTRRVARFLDVSPETVLRYYRQGRLRGHRLAGQRNVLRFRRQDVLSFIGHAETLDA